MADERVDELVCKAYEGEVLGTELFRRLAAAEADPERSRRLFAAQLLEEQTMGAAAVLARDLGVELPADGVEQGAAAAEALAPMAWPDRMGAIAEGTGGYLALYTELEEALGSTTHPSVAALHAHERALHAFADAERDGRDDLDALLAALDDEHRARFDAFPG